MRKLPYQSSLQFIQRPQLLWNDIGDRKLWRGIQWIRRGPTVPSRLSWNAYQSNIPKPRSGVRWKHGMRRFSEYGNVASRFMPWPTMAHHGQHGQHGPGGPGLQQQSVGHRRLAAADPATEGPALRLEDHRQCGAGAAAGLAQCGNPGGGEEWYNQCGIRFSMVYH